MTARRTIPITRPDFGDGEFLAVQEPLRSGWVVQGPAVKEFEDKFSTFTGAPHSAAVTSCTTALHLAMAALEVEPGDEVVVPAFTWVATPNAVEYMRATPRFCDISLETFNAEADAMEAVLTKRTVGLLPVHLFGLPATMDPILEIATQGDLWVVEDAACAFGSWYRGRHAGTLGVMGCFSFHPRKSITTGEGGMVVTSDSRLDGIIRSLRDHGASRSDLSRHESKAAYLLADYDRLGFNFRMTDLQGAVGSVQMDRADWILSERRRCAERYDSLLAERDWLRLPPVPDDRIHGYQSYVCLFAPLEPTLRSVDRLHDVRNRIMARLEDQGIATRQGTHAAALQGYYVSKYGYRPEDFPNAYLADRLSISLPIFPRMTDDDLGYVAEALDSAFAESWRS